MNLFSLYRTRRLEARRKRSIQAELCSKDVPQEWQVTYENIVSRIAKNVFELDNCDHHAITVLKYQRMLSQWSTI